GCGLIRCFRGRLAVQIRQLIIICMLKIKVFGMLFLLEQYREVLEAIWASGVLVQQLMFFHTALVLV
ncbi:hypothetical protein DP092_21645, partial [Pseudomonas sp. MDMC224]